MAGAMAGDLDGVMLPPLQKRLGERFVLARCLDLLGLVAMAEGDFAGSRAALQESLQLYHEIGDRAGVADTLDSIAGLAAAEGQSERAVQLVGPAASIRGQIGAALSPMRRTQLEHWLELESNQRALAYQTSALATELPR